MTKALFLALAVLAPLASAQTPQTIDIHNLPGGATVIENVVVPVPSEIFAVLDKVGNPRWKEVLRPVKGMKTPSDPEQIALLLGTIIAEGFIAVEAQDVTEVKNIGNSVTKLAAALSVEKAVKIRASAIIDAAEKKDWKSVRKELDAVQHDATSAMHEMKSDEVAQLVSLGGWLRGTEALTEVVKNEYKQDSADLLHQPSLLGYFERRLSGMSPKMQAKPLVAKMKKGLNEIKPLMAGPDDASISEKTVGDIQKVAADLGKAIHTKSN